MLSTYFCVLSKFIAWIYYFPVVTAALNCTNEKQKMKLSVNKMDKTRTDRAMPEHVVWFLFSFQIGEDKP